MSVLVARLIQEGGARVHELHAAGGEYVLRLLVKDVGGMRHVQHSDRVITRREAGEWIQMTLRCGGYVPRALGRAS